MRALAEVSKWTFMETVTLLAGVVLAKIRSSSSREPHLTQMEAATKPNRIFTTLVLYRKSFLSKALALLDTLEPILIFVRYLHKCCIEIYQPQA